MEMMAASQRSQHEAFQELVRVSKDKSNDSMFTAIKHSTEQIDKCLKIGSTKLTRLAGQVIEDSRTELFKKSAGAVRQVILSCDNFSDDKLVTKLRSCFSHAPTMNKAREDL